MAVMRFRASLAFVFLASLQLPLWLMAAEKSDVVLVCDPTPKIISFGDEYHTRTPETGTTVVEVTIELTGVVSAARIVKSSNPRLNERTLNAAEKWVFEPPNVAYRAQITVHQRIDDEIRA